MAVKNPIGRAAKPALPPIKALGTGNQATSLGVVTPRGIAPHANVGPANATKSNGQWTQLIADKKKLGQLP